MSNNGKKRKSIGVAPLYQTPQELQEKIEEYFDKGVRFRTVIVGPPNNRSEIIIKIPTITGLCLYLGFESRQSFYAYENKPEFSYTIKKARMMIEREYEEQLQTSTPTGAIFALKNFGWKDKLEVSADEIFKDRLQVLPEKEPLPLNRIKEFIN